MNTYRIGAIQSPIGDYRPRTQYVEANTFDEAAALAQAMIEENHTIVEVALTQPLITATDDEITAALELWLGENGDEADDFKGYLDHSFHTWVTNVAAALQQSPIAHNLHVSLLHQDGGVDYAMVELRQTDHNYRSTGEDIKHLTYDREATGMPGLLAIAQALIEIANSIR